MYESGSPRSLPGMSKAVVPSPLVYDVVEDGAIYDIGSFSYIEDSTRHRLPVCLRQLQGSKRLFVDQLHTHIMSVFGIV